MQLLFSNFNMKLRFIFLLAFTVVLNSCKKEVEFKIIKNPNLTYFYRDNLRGDNFQINILKNKMILHITEKDGKTHTQEDLVSKVVQITEKEYDENSDVIIKYIVNIENFSHIMITEYYDRVEIKTNGIIEKYEDSNDETNYKWLGETILAVKK